jgi:hypothetical protein
VLLVVVLSWRVREPLVSTRATPPVLVAEFSVRVHVVKMAEPLCVTRTTPPYCEQKNKRKKEERERERRREEQRQRGEKKKDEENVRVFLLISAVWLVKKKKKVYSTQVNSR